jgi:hypothetical protein
MYQKANALHCEVPPDQYVSLGFRSLTSAPKDDGPILLAYRPEIDDFKREVDFDVILARRCSFPHAEAWIPLSLDPDDKVTCALGAIKGVLGWLPMSALR